MFRALRGGVGNGLSVIPKEEDMQTDQMGRVLEDLIQTLEDGKKGFSEAAEKLSANGRADLAARMREYSEQREAFSNELRSVAAQEGLTIEEEGSVAGALHRGWMSLKEALTSDEAGAILSAAENGEDHAKAEYADALDEELPEGVRSVIARQASAVLAAHDEVRALRDREVS